MTLDEWQRLKRGDDVIHCDLFGELYAGHVTRVGLRSIAVKLAGRPKILRVHRLDRKCLRVGRLLPGVEA